MQKWRERAEVFVVCVVAHTPEPRFRPELPGDFALLGMVQRDGVLLMSDLLELHGGRVPYACGGFRAI